MVEGSPVRMSLSTIISKLYAEYKFKTSFKIDHFPKIRGNLSWSFFAIFSTYTGYECLRNKRCFKLSLSSNLILASMRTIPKIDSS